MGQPSRGQVALYLALAVVVALLGSRYLAKRDPALGGAAAPALDRAPLRVRQAGGEALTVHVAGAVRRPGVYRLRAGARVNDALRRAGGPTPAALLAGVNLAAKLEDGRQVIVPARSDPGAPSPQQAATPQPLDLNSATVEQLDELDGIGPATARRIVAHRERSGGFRSVDELDLVPGIGEGRMAMLRELVRV